MLSYSLRESQRSCVCIQTRQETLSREECSPASDWSPLRLDIDREDKLQIELDPDRILTLQK